MGNYSAKVLAVIGALVMFALQNAPDTAFSNGAKWLELVGVSDIPSWVASPKFDTIGTVIAGAVTLVCVLLIMRASLRRKTNTTIGTPIDGVANASPDCNFSEAQEYIANKSAWGDTTKADIRAATNELRRAAIDGSVKVWGNKSLALQIDPFEFVYSDVLTEVPGEYFYKYKMLPNGIDAFQRQAHTEIEDRSDKKPDWPRYRGLSFNMDQIRKTWPPRKSRFR